MARVRKARSHASRNLDDHLLDKAKFVELNAQDAPVDNVNWDVQQAEVHSDPVYDAALGPKAVIRRFRFKLPPGLEQQPSHEELMNYHRKHTVIPLLYKDELELIQEPRIIAGKKGTFTIVAICSPRTVMGVKSFIHEKAEAVQDIINGPRKNPN